MGEGDKSVGELLSQIMGADGLQRTMNENQRARLAWYSVNGDIEHEHTTGVFVKKGKTAGAAPILGVYVDSRTRAVDFRANREIYLARLSMSGYSFSDVEFLVTKYPKKAAARRIEEKEEASADELPELSPEETARVEDLVKDVPDAIRETVFKAVSLSMRREKSADTPSRQNARK